MSWWTACLAVALTALWMLLFGDFGPLFALAGAVVAFAALRFSRSVVGTYRREQAARRIGHRAPSSPVDAAGRLVALVRLVGLYLFELLKSNLMMTRDVLSPRPRMELGIFALKVPELGPAEMTLLANLIGLTPGTTAIDYDESEGALYIQTVYAHDVESMRQEYRRFTRLICRVTGLCTPEAAGGEG